MSRRAVLTLFVIAACSMQPSNEVPSPSGRTSSPSPWMRGVYEDRNGIFRIRYPSTWEPLDRQYVLLGDLVLRKKASVVALGVLVYPRGNFGPQFTPRRILDAAQPTPLQGEIEVRVGREGPISIAGLPGWERFRTFVAPSGPYLDTRLYETVAIGDHWVIAFSLNSPSDGFAAQVADAREIMESLELID